MTDGPRRLTDTEVEGLVVKVLAGGAGSLEAVVHAALYPDGAPEKWGEWSPEAIRVWDRCVELYVAAALRDAGGGASVKSWTRNTLSVEEAWRAILDVAPDPAEWWELGVAWPAVANRLGLSYRVATYRMEALGWKFGDGRGGRRVLRAPCWRCGASRVPSELDASHRCADQDACRM